MLQLLSKSIKTGDTILIDNVHFLDKFGQLFNQVLGKSGKIFCFEQDQVQYQTAKQKYNIVPSIYYYNNSLAQETKGKQIQIDAFLDNLEAKAQALFISTAVWDILKGAYNLLRQERPLLIIKSTDIPSTQLPKINTLLQRLSYKVAHQTSFWVCE